MIRAIGFNAGLRGDLCMATVAARSFKEQHPDSHFTLAVGPQFKDLLPLFHDHPYIDATHVWSIYDNWPAPKDVEYLKAAKYDMVFHPKPEHRDHQWWTLRHQYAEAAHMVGLPIPKDIKPVLTRWFNLDRTYENCVAIAAFGGNGGVNDKQLSYEQAQELADRVSDLTHCKVVQLGAPSEPALEGAIHFVGSYFDAVRTMLSCRLLIHCDTGMGHVAGAYNHPSLGLYAYRYFGKQWAHQIRPLHEKHVAIEAETIDKIDLDNVFKTLKLMLT